MAAEKVTGLWGVDIISHANQAKCLAKILNDFQNSSDLIEMSLKAEQQFLELSEKFYSCLENSNELTLGLDDAIMSIASDREESVYLLKQVQKG